MTIYELDSVALYMRGFYKLWHIRRVNDVLLEIELKGERRGGAVESGADSSAESTTNPASSTNFANPAKSHKLDSITLYFDMTRGKSSIFTASQPIICAKKYNAPFDIALERLAKSEILSCALVDNDRVMRLKLLQKGSYKQSEVAIQFEFSGKHTNVILLNEAGLIIDALRHITLAQSSRPVRVGAPLAPIPKNPRAKMPESKNADSAKKDFTGADFIGVDSTKADSSARESNIESKAAQDSATLANPAPLMDSAQVLAMLAKNYEAKSAQDLQNKKQTLIARLTRARSKLAKLYAALPQSSALESKSKALRDDANLLLSHIHTLKPYQTSAILSDTTLSDTISSDTTGNDATSSDAISDTTGTLREVAIPLASAPQDAINQLFRESKKAAKKAKNIHKEAQNLKDKIDFLDKEIAFISQCTTLDMLQILTPQKSSANASKASESNGVVMFIEGFKISVGRSERENKALLESAKAEDIWLHIKDLPSSHMIIHCGKQKIPSEVIEKAGEILVGLSGTQAGDFCVDYTRRKFVKIVQGASVIYAKHQSLHYRK
ncbi:hypothetical protein BKN38_04450 [Helicobacter sp. CLO-3]|uniref:NFACT family protein n=1 Tax=unclassified Helicobacter TaxID=2593540 RepID=UPI000805D035|nr:MULTISPECIES: NFACT family protein [unclassified Helicobacter]OBV29946.1 hypothetical protein BA723_03430 [Helicobacter sp. CLO-3]OHU83947.1 hypothetical protein BKN38_04450 [Helicobacter sp. CLO-3]